MILKIKKYTKEDESNINPILASGAGLGAGIGAALIFKSIKEKKTSQDTVNLKNN